MASPGQRENENPTLAPQSPHFFKIILPETLLQQKLKIPKKFVRKYGSTLLNSVFLEVPSGEVWQIDLVRYDNGEVWLENGWKPFVESYSLSPGHLVAFRYEGNSCFGVFIYDVSTSEIDYRPNGDVRGKRLNTPKMEAISVENVDDYDPRTQPPKRKRSNSTGETNNGSLPLASQSDRTPELEMSEGNLDLRVNDFAVKEGGDMPIGHQSVKKFTFDKKARSLRRTGGFKTENPFFKIFLQPSYIYPGTSLIIPENFVHRHFPQKAGIVTLSTSDGRTWLVKYIVKMKRAKLYGGWKVFVVDNGLKAGDICVFEMIKGSEFSLRVVIFRDVNFPLSQAHRNEVDKDEQNRTIDLEAVESEDGTSLDISGSFSPSQKQGVEGRNVHARCQRLKSNTHANTRVLDYYERTKKLQKARDFKSESPFFVVVMQRSYIHKGPKLSIPAEFMQRHFTSDHCDVILFTEDRRTWPAMYKFEVANGKRSAKIYSGWKSFAADNGLKVGDVCVFELKKGTKVIFRVLIFRQTDNENIPSSKENPTEESQNDNEPVKELGKKGRGWRPSRSISLRSLETISEEFPSFCVVMSSAYVQKGCVAVPKRFARKFIKNGSCALKLQVGDKFWPLKLITYENHNKSVLSKGWCSFAEKNALQVGDACTFELINKNDGIIKVSISRVSS